MKLKSFKRILIANRGEIAWRIQRTCKAMGIETVAIYSLEDKSTPVVKYADQACQIFHSNKLAYLDIQQILGVAKKYGCEAIHPGYGFLSENEEFALACHKNGVTFIGPRPETLKLFGNKSSSKELAKKISVPCLEGFSLFNLNDSQIVNTANALGFPVLLKAAHGGGGRGIRKVSSEDELLSLIQITKEEALIGFGKDELLIEKYLGKCRHIEFQIFGDSHGNQIHLGERDCSLQRRNQKIIEETPSAISKNLRQKMAEAALKIAKACDYLNAGTVEFLVTEKEEFYFLEVNPRLQVEHPVTEMVTGLDLVKLQIQIAQNQPLGLKQSDIQFNGYATEFRINCEDPALNFAPDSGSIFKIQLPRSENIRIDHWISNHTKVSNQFDNLLAKIIVHGSTREEVHRKSIQALSELRILGVKSNKNFLLHLIQLSEYLKQKTTTGFIDSLSYKSETSYPIAPSILACLCHVHDQMPKLNYPLLGWRNDFSRKYFFEGLEYTLKGTNKSLEVTMSSNIFNITSLDRTQFKLTSGQENFEILYHLSDSDYFIDIDGISICHSLNKNHDDETNIEDEAIVVSPIAGKLTQIRFKNNATVKAGDELFIVEAMKMQMSVRAQRSGQIIETIDSAGVQVKSRQRLAKIKVNEDL